MKIQFFRAVVLIPVLGGLTGCTEPAEKPVEIQVVTSPPAQGTACPAEGVGALVKAGADAVHTLRVTFFDAAQGPPSVDSLVCERLVAADESGMEFFLRFPRNGRLHVRAEAFGLPAQPGDATPLVGAGALDDVLFAEAAEPPRLFLPLSGRFGCGLGSLAKPRAFHTATALPGGQVVVAAGLVASSGDLTLVDEGNGLFITDSIEIYDPQTGRFIQPEIVGDVGVPRAFHTAVLLRNATADRSEILLLGGVAYGTVAPGNGAVRVRTGPDEPLRLTPAVGAGPAPTERLTIDFVGGVPVVTRTLTGLDDWPASFFHATTTWGEGGPCVAGGATSIDATGTFDVLQTVDLGFANTGAHYPTQGALTQPRAGHTLTYDASDMAIVWGGNAGGSLAELLTIQPTPSTSVPLVQDVAGSTEATPIATVFHTATPIAGGDLIIIGGFAIESGLALHPNASSPILRFHRSGATEYQLFTQDATGLEPVGYHATVLLPDGRLLVTGGTPEFDPGVQDCPGGDQSWTCSVPQAWVFTPGDTPDQLGVLAAAFGPLQQARFGHTAVVLADGLTVLIVGGLDRTTGELHTVGAAEVLSLATGSAAEDLPLHRDPGTLSSPERECPVY